MCHVRCVNHSTGPSVCCVCEMCPQVLSCGAVLCVLAMGAGHAGAIGLEPHDKANIACEGGDGGVPAHNSPYAYTRVRMRERASGMRASGGRLPNLIMRRMHECERI